MFRKERLVKSKDQTGCVASISESLRVNTDFTSWTILVTDSFYQGQEKLVDIRKI